MPQPIPPARAPPSIKPKCCHMDIGLDITLDFASAAESFIGVVLELWNYGLSCVFTSVAVHNRRLPDRCGHKRGCRSVPVIPSLTLDGLNLGQFGELLGVGCNHASSLFSDSTSNWSASAAVRLAHCRNGPFSRLARLCSHPNTQDVAIKAV